MESDEGAGPSSSVLQYPNIDEVQKQQDKLVELMQETAQERDALREQLKLLTSQLEDVQSRLQQQPQAKVKESSHQACQTDTQTDYKGLFERAKQKINDLIRDKEALLEEKSTLAAQCEELKLRMQQQRENARSSAGSRTSDRNLNLSLVHVFSSIPLFSLIELRQNVGRLLVSRVPALDLAQVNFECNVIDEILEQVLTGTDF
uniref:Uncharacterized protein n=1 Tax=Poecilia reticulata TaxID=8081 RepID=A0A3P9MVB2_POERE